MLFLSMIDSQTLLRPSWKQTNVYKYPSERISRCCFQRNVYNALADIFIHFAWQNYDCSKRSKSDTLEITARDYNNNINFYINYLFFNSDAHTAKLRRSFFSSTSVECVQELIQFLRSYMIYFLFCCCLRYFSLL